MRIVLDTNILVRRVEKSHPMHLIVNESIVTLRNRDCAFFVFMQNVSEFWNVCTRPIENNGLGLSISETDQHLSRFEELFIVLPDNEPVFKHWRELVVKHSIVGVKVHDAKIVAAMIAHGIEHLFTLNVSDFKRFSEITTFSPGESLEYETLNSQ